MKANWGCPFKTANTEADLSFKRSVYRPQEESLPNFEGASPVWPLPPLQKNYKGGAIHLLPFPTFWVYPILAWNFKFVGLKSTFCTESHFLDIFRFFYLMFECVNWVLRVVVVFTVNSFQCGYNIFASFILGNIEYFVSNSSLFRDLAYSLPPFQISQRLSHFNFVSFINNARLLLC